MVGLDWAELFVVDIIFSSKIASIALRNSAHGKIFLIHISIETGSILVDLLQKKAPQRPNTFTLLSNCIVSLGGTLRAAIIDDTRNGVFFAKIMVHGQGANFPIDTRPSDAIALALVNNLPIFAPTNLIEKLSWVDIAPISAEKSS
jgi:bifunctional DNase/RNase